MLIVERVPLYEFLSTDLTETGWKRAFYLDGKLFRVFDEKGDRQRAVGRSHFASVDPSGPALILSEYGQPQYQLSLTEEVDACGDVALWKGASREHMANRLRRYASPIRTFGASHLDVYLQTRVTMGCVDYRIVTDNLGLESKRVSVRWAVPPSVTVIDEPALGGRAVTFSFHNDPTNREPLVALSDVDFVIAGPHLAFSQPSQPGFV